MFLACCIAFTGIIYNTRENTQKHVNRSRLQIAKPDIFRFIDQLPTRVHRLSDIRRYLSEQRTFWRLAHHTTAAHFITFLIDSGRLSKVDFPFPPPYKREVRYAWGKTSIYQVMLSLNSAAYFSHYTALWFHGLTEQLPKTTYLSVELPKISGGSSALSQKAIDAAFRRRQRVTKNVAETRDFRLCMLSAKNTNHLGVERDTVMPEHGPLRFTNLERTLIDASVRPVYAGGVFEVRKAFELAKEKVSVNRLAALLQKLDYTYPYHQAIGFYLERTSYDPEIVSLLRRFPMSFDFYLAHDMGQTEYIRDWRLYVPKGF
jgi:predicted transcriptional regulator of viral defense system